MKRREAIQLFTAAAAATVAGGPTFGQDDKVGQKLRVLIFGGTASSGRISSRRYRRADIRSLSSTVAAATPGCSRISKR